MPPNNPAGVPRIAELRRFHEQATPDPWEHTLAGEAGVYAGLRVESPGCIKYKARILRPGEDEDELDDLREVIDNGEYDKATLRPNDQALLRLEENLRIAAAARNALPALLDIAEAAIAFAVMCPTCEGRGLVVLSFGAVATDCKTCAPLRAAIQKLRSLE